MEMIESSSISLLKFVRATLEKIIFSDTLIQKGH